MIYNWGGQQVVNLGYQVSNTVYVILSVENYHEIDSVLNRTRSE